MFGLFAPKCPLDTQDKTWIEGRMVWLADRFGVDRMRNATVVLPTPEFFPDPYTPDEAGFRHTLRRVCGYMGMDPNSLRCALADDEQMPGAAGLYERREKSVIYVARGQLDDPAALIATLAHELAHELLLKGGHLTADEPDHEYVTDLLPVFLGVGVFRANATVREKVWRDPHGTYSQVSRQGYLSSLQLGYALAVFAFVRGEYHPKWVKHLRPDAGVTMKAALHFLRKTGDTLFHPTTYGERRGTPAAGRLADDLAHPSPTVRLNALWEVTSHTPPPPELLPAVEGCLRHRDPAVRRVAVEVLGVYGPPAAGNVPALVAALDHGPTDLRCAAATALGRIAADADLVIPALASVLNDAHPAVIAAAGIALAGFGPKAAAAEPQLMTALEATAHLSDTDSVAALLTALRAAVPDAPDRIKAHFNGGDPEVRRVVIGELLRQRASENRTRRFVG